MNHTTAHARLMRHLVTTQSPWGLRALRLHVQYVRWLRQAWLFGRPALKRTFDISGSVLFLLLFSPLYLLIALLVKLEDGGPVIFAQTRVGLHGRVFKFYKFRSMCVDAEARLKELLALNQHAEGVTFKMKQDPRLTRTGRWLRRYSLDELPQFVNVLLGDMSIVGPRPPVPREVALYSLADRRRLAVKPGITCLWQIGGRSEIDFSGQVALDVKYIEEQNLWGDITIVAKTMPAVLSGKGAC
jgi:lipopolysaccharide/colanic/teichoic acid biosynthesis glycosyltransferase